MPRRTLVVARHDRNKPLKDQKDMNVTMRSIHFAADRKLVQLIKEKLGKLTQFHDNILAVDVGLKLERDTNNRENKVVEMKMTVPGDELFAKRQGKFFEEAAINTVEALRSQLIKSKERLRVAS